MIRSETPQTRSADAMEPNCDSENAKPPEVTPVSWVEEYAASGAVKDGEGDL